MKVVSTAPTTLVAVCLGAFGAIHISAQQATPPKRVLALYWFSREFDIDLEYDRQLQARLHSSLGEPLEYYSEYLDQRRFPELSQSLLMRDYLRKKYADRTIDVVITNVPIPLKFLMRNRGSLFPEAKIVFANIDWPPTEQLTAGPGATGIVFAMTHKKTVELALQLQPDTRQVFVVSGTLNHDRSYELAAQKQLAGFAGRVKITYLTDLAVEELSAKLRNLPNRSVVLYVRQFTRDARGKVYEPSECLPLITNAARVPVYVMANANLREGALGGYVWTIEGNAAKLAELVVRVLNGTRPLDIPVEIAPSIPMFDWSQLQRWNIAEDSLPANAVLLNRRPTMWEQYRWRIVAGVVVLVLQALLIGALLVATRRATRNADQLRRAQQVLRESEERFRNLADTAPVMIAVSDHQGRAVFFNKRWLEFTGRALDAETGSGWASSVHPDERDDCLEKVKAAYRERRECVQEFRLRSADGQYRWMIYRGIPRIEADGRYAGHIASIIDITDLKQAVASQKLECLGVLTSGIAHDFNNFLGGILASAELMLAELEDLSPLRREVEQIRFISMRAAEIVRQLMAYAGEEGAHFENVDVAQVIHEMRDLMALTISKKALLNVDIAPDLPPIRGSAAEIRQLTMNLITNASDALSEAGGTIWVSGTEMQGPAETNDNPDGQWIRLEVRDSGVGMTDDVQRRIFDPFFSTKGAGRGMGLAAVKGIVQSHKGTITVKSAVGQGTRMVVLLPRAGTEATSAMVPAIAPPDRESDSPGTVLIVDDETALRKPIVEMLRRRGYIVLDAGDGVRAVDLFRKHAAEIDVVVLDLTLPGLSGPDVLKELRRIQPAVIVVLATAYGRSYAFESVDQPDGVSYLRKPYHIQELTDLLQSLRAGTRAAVKS